MLIWQRAEGSSFCSSPTQLTNAPSAVEFMNSTALGAFVSWVAELQKMAVAARYKINFLGSQKRRWQRASLHALASFAPELISVSFPT